MADSTVTVVGNVTRDPEMRYTPSGVAKASFGVAVSRRWQNRNTQEWEEQTSFFNVVCWRDMAENVCESIGKGARVVVNGRLEQRSWETENGDKRSVVEIVADDIGPSLRWATAEVRRNERRGSFDSAGAAGAAGAGGGGGGERVSAARGPRRDCRRHGGTLLAMARPRRTKRDAPERKPKKKVSILDSESIAWVDYKDVALLRRFMSERAKIRRVA